MKKTFFTVAALTALGALALLASAHTSNDSGSAVDTTPTTPTPRKPQPVAPRCATRAEIIALLEEHVKESRTGGGHAKPVGRTYSTIGRKRAVMFPDLTPEVRDAFVIFLYEEVGMSHREISHIVALSPRAIAHRLHAVGVVRYVEKSVSSQNTTLINK